MTRHKFSKRDEIYIKITTKMKQRQSRAKRFFALKWLGKCVFWVFISFLWIYFGFFLCELWSWQLIVWQCLYFLTTASRYLWFWLWKLTIVLCEELSLIASEAFCFIVFISIFQHVFIIFFSSSFYSVFSLPRCQL